MLWMVEEQLPFTFPGGYELVQLLYVFITLHLLTARLIHFKAAVFELRLGESCIILFQVRFAAEGFVGLCQTICLPNVSRICQTKTQRGCNGPLQSTTEYFYSTRGQGSSAPMSHLKSSSHITLTKLIGGGGVGEIDSQTNDRFRCKPIFCTYIVLSLFVARIYPEPNL